MRFRIKPECIDAALADFRDAGVEPDRIEARPEEGEVAVEFHRLTYDDAAKLGRAFNPEYSAIIGVIGGPPFED
ncbi:hypothetical protein [Sphingomonas hankookensis]